MKILFVIVSVIIFGIFIFFAVRQYLYSEPLSTPMTQNETKSISPEPDPEGERITTPEGVVMQDITFGTGETAETGNLLTVHYVGTLKDGTVFDASTARGEPFKFTLGVGEVIQGWDIGMMGMKEGGVRQLIIPANLAYGETSVGAIPPGSELTFLVQLIQVEKR